MLGYDVTVRPATTPASTRVHGPWQMAATGLPEFTKSRTNDTAELSSRKLVRIHRAAGQNQRVELIDGYLRHRPIDSGIVPAGSKSWLRACMSSVFSDSS